VGLGVVKDNVAYGCLWFGCMMALSRVMSKQWGSSC
jgi:hypothetical protein